MIGPRHRPSEPLSNPAAVWRWVRTRPEVLVIAASILCVIVALTVLREPTAGDPAGVVDPLASEGPLVYAPGMPTGSPPDPLASDDATMTAASEAAALASAAASAPQPSLPPPLPSAVLAPEDSVFAAGGSQPLETPAAPVKRKPGPVLIFDAGAEEAGETDDPAPTVSAAPQLRSVTKPAVAAASANSLTRGTTIPAVLESAIDAGQPGGVRAMVSTDVRSADGRRLLVPRSSRLVGQYRADPGKSRAYVIWTRLEKPDGSRVALNSVAGPAARFLESYAASSLVSQVSGASGTNVRVRPGEPIRVIASRSVDLQTTRR